MIGELIENNRRWAAGKHRDDPRYFRRLSQLQTPQYLWIGCADSRVPANEIVGLDPGELFVHRNVANLAIPTDINFLSVLAYAVNVLKVRHVIVCGHYGCGGVHAAIGDERHGVIDHWLEPVRETYRRERVRINRIRNLPDRVNALCEQNVKAQVANVADTIILRDAWARGQAVSIHGWIYALADGLIRDLDVSVDGNSESQGGRRSS